MAARSHARAAAATNSGRFRDEIVPVETTWIDPKTGEEKKMVVDKDDGIREGVTAAQLGKLPAVFKKGGSTTAGNSSQVGCPIRPRKVPPCHTFLLKCLHVPALVTLPTACMPTLVIYGSCIVGVLHVFYLSYMQTCIRWCTCTASHLQVVAWA